MLYKNGKFFHMYVTPVFIYGHAVMVYFDLYLMIWLFICSNLKRRLCWQTNGNFDRWAAKRQRMAMWCRK